MLRGRARKTHIHFLALVLALVWLPEAAQYQGLIHFPLCPLPTPPFPTLLTPPPQMPLKGSLQWEILT